MMKILELEKVKDQICNSLTKIDNWGLYQLKVKAIILN